MLLKFYVFLYGIFDSDVNEPCEAHIVELNEISSIIGFHLDMISTFDV